MDIKCKYCWKIYKIENLLVVLKCLDKICRNCLLLLHKNRINYCPLCSRTINESEFIVYLNSPKEKELSIKPSKKLEDFISDQLPQIRTISKKIHSHINSKKQLKSLDLESLKLSSKSSQSINTIITDLQLIKDSKIIELSKLCTFQSKKNLSAKKFDEEFINVYFSNILANLMLNNTIWLGKKLKILESFKKNTEQLLITNKGQSKVIAYSFAYGICLNSTSSFFSEKFYIQVKGMTYYINRKDLVRDETKISYEANTINFEIEPNETLLLTVNYEPGNYIAIKNSKILIYNNCNLSITNENKCSLVLHIKFR